MGAAWRILRMNEVAAACNAKWTRQVEAPSGRAKWTRQVGGSGSATDREISAEVFEHAAQNRSRRR